MISDHKIYIYENTIMSVLQIHVHIFTHMLYTCSQANNYKDAQMYVYNGGREYIYPWTVLGFGTVWVLCD